VLSSKTRTHHPLGDVREFDGIFEIACRRVHEVTVARNFGKRGFGDAECR
jgi:hypothetical protein